MGVKVENWSKVGSKIRTTEPHLKISGSYIKKSVNDIHFRE